MGLEKFIGLPGGANEFSTQGYKKNSPDKDNPFNVINSGDITMKDVKHPVFGMDDLGNGQMMYPGMDYSFPGSKVVEFPIKQDGGEEPNPYTVTNIEEFDTGFDNPFYSTDDDYRNMLGRIQGYQNFGADPTDRDLNRMKNMFATHIPGERRNTYTEFPPNLTPEAWENFKLREQKKYDQAIEKQNQIVNQQDGGYIDMDLDETEIANLRAKGFRIEEL